MASISEDLRILAGKFVGPDRTVPWTIILAIAVVGWWIASSWMQPVSKFSTINDPKRSWTSFPAKKAYVQNARELLKEGYRKVRPTEYQTPHDRR
jgi:hypothetical protein